MLVTNVVMFILLVAMVDVASAVDVNIQLDLPQQVGDSRRIKIVAERLLEDSNIIDGKVVSRSGRAIRIQAEGTLRVDSVTRSGNVLRETFDIDSWTLDDEDEGYEVDFANGAITVISDAALPRFLKSGEKPNRDETELLRVLFPALTPNVGLDESLRVTGTVSPNGQWAPRSVRRLHGPWEEYHDGREIDWSRLSSVCRSTSVRSDNGRRVITVAREDVVPGWLREGTELEAKVTRSEIWHRGSWTIDVDTKGLIRRSMDLGWTIDTKPAVRSANAALVMRQSVRWRQTTYLLP